MCLKFNTLGLLIALLRSLGHHNWAGHGWPNLPILRRRRQKSSQQQYTSAARHTKCQSLEYKGQNSLTINGQHGPNMTGMSWKSSDLTKKVNQWKKIADKSGSFQSNSVGNLSSVFIVLLIFAPLFNFTEFSKFLTFLENSSKCHAA